MIDILNQSITGEKASGTGGVDFSIPFVEGEYKLKLVEVGDWKARPVRKNYEVKEWNFKEKAMEVVKIIPELTPYSCMITLRVLEAPEGHEELEGREIKDFLNLQPNTMFIVKSFLAAIIGEGGELPPALFKELEGLELKAKLKPDTYESSKDVADPETGIIETQVTTYQTAEVENYLAKE